MTPEQGDEQIDAPEDDSHEGEALVIGALFIALTTPGVAVALDDLEIDRDLPAIELRFDWLPTRYRLSVEPIDDGR